MCRGRDIVTRHIAAYPGPYFGHIPEHISHLSYLAPEFRCVHTTFTVTSRKYAYPHQILYHIPESIFRQEFLHLLDGLEADGKQNTQADHTAGQTTTWAFEIETKTETVWLHTRVCCARSDPFAPTPSPPRSHPTSRSTEQPRPQSALASLFALN